MRRIALLLSLLLAACTEAPPPAALGPAKYEPSEVGIVILHGRLGMPSYLQRLAADLRGLGYRVLTPEMSWSRQRAWDRDVAGSLDEIDAALARLRADGAKLTVLAGHSLGGAMTACHTAQRPPADAVLLMAAAWNPSGGYWQAVVGQSVGRAAEAVAAGKGAERANYTYLADGGGPLGVIATAIGFHDFNRPDSPINLPDCVANWKKPLANLWIAASGESQMAAQVKRQSLRLAPPHPLGRFETLTGSHIGVVQVALPTVTAWLDRVRR
ncbi:MAG: hypothetical protein FJX46_07210 [Alphaproteobacteria bacterium]|nr:hypothetical protein [Alphaproteobacteria bacterium]